MKIVLTPDWFIGKDLPIYFISLVVLIIISVLAIRSYKLNKKNKGLLNLGIGFGLIALATLAGVFTKLVLYYDIGPAQAIGQAIITSQIFSSVDVFYYLGFFFHNLLFLIGLYIIYRVPKKRLNLGDYVLTLYLLALSALLSVNEGFFYLFNLTSLILLTLIIKHYYKIYKENKFANTKLLLIVFSILALSNFIYIFSQLEILYVLANIIEILSYVILLFLIIRILKHGEKKKPYEHNIRYADNNPRKKRRN